MKNQAVRDLETVPVSLRSACDMRRACSPHVAVAHFSIEFSLGDERRPPSPPPSTSMAVRAHQCCQRFPALLAIVGLQTSKLLTSTPSFLAIGGIERMLGIDERGPCSSLLRLGKSPCKAMVVLRMTLGRRFRRRGPRGTPRTPSAASNEIAPVEITEMGNNGFLRPPAA